MTERGKKGRMTFRGTGSVSWTVAFSLCLLLAALQPGLHPISGQEANDRDADGMDDSWEAEHGFNSSDPDDANLDPDGDGLDNLGEYLNGTDPALNDTDMDGMDDGWEVENGLDPTDPSDAGEDPDGDHLTNLMEYRSGTDPRKPSVSANDDTTSSPSESGAEKAASSLIFLGILFFLMAGTVILVLVIGIYSRIRRERLLDHETRQRIVDHLRKNPGSYYSQIRRDLELPHGVLSHHLNMLEQQELIFSKQDRSYRRFFIDGMYYGKGPIVIGMQKRVLDIVRWHPGLSQSGIGRKLGVGRMLVSYHVNRLEGLGLVVKIRRGREKLIHPSPVDPGKSDEVADSNSQNGMAQVDGGLPGIGSVESAS